MGINTTPRNRQWVVTRNNPVVYALYMDDEHICYLGEHIQDTLKMVISRYPKSVLKPILEKKQQAR